MSQLFTRLSEFISSVFEEAYADDVGLLSAAFVYFATISLVPLLTLLLSVATVALQASAAFEMLIVQVTTFADQLLGPEFTAGLEESLTGIGNRSLIVGLISTGALLVTGSVVFHFVNRGFRRIWNVPKPRRGEGNMAFKTIQRTLTSRLFAFASLFVMLAVLIASVIVYSIIEVVGELFGTLPLITPTIRLLEGGVTLGLVTLLFALLYRLLPPLRPPWQAVWPAAVFSAGALLALRWGLVLYIVLVGTRSAFGAIGTFLVVMGWLYAVGYVIFIGAEICKVQARSGVAAPALERKQ